MGRRLRKPETCVLNCAVIPPCSALIRLDLAERLIRPWSGADNEGAERRVEERSIPGRCNATP